MSSALLNYAMEKSPSWEANRFSASQEISRILWNPNVHYRIYKCLPRAPSWARSIQSMPTHPTTWRSILIRSSNLCLDLSGCLFPFRLPSSLLLRATCPTHLILLDLITRKILDKECRSLSSSLCSVLYSPVTSSLLGPNILLSTIFSNTHSLHSSLHVSDQVSHPYKTTGKLIIMFTLYCWISLFFGYQIVRQKILHRIIASIPCLQSAINLLLNRILIC